MTRIYIETQLWRDREALKARAALAQGRADRIGAKSNAYDRLLETQGHVQRFEEERLDRLVSIAGRASDYAQNLEARIVELTKAIDALEEEAILIRQGRMARLNRKRKVVSK